jgi:hypothetical protein
MPIRAISRLCNFVNRSPLGHHYKRLEVQGALAQCITRARVAELADAPDLGSGSERIRGSSPLARTSLRSE